MSGEELGSCSLGLGLGVLMLDHGQGVTKKLQQALRRPCPSAALCATHRAADGPLSAASTMGGPFIDKC